MAARTNNSALLYFRPAFSSSCFRNRLRNANRFPFCNFSPSSSHPPNTSNGNPRYCSSAATDAIKSARLLNYLRNLSDPTKIRNCFTRPADDPALGPGFHAFRIAAKKLAKAKAYDKVEEVLERLFKRTRPCPEETVIKVMRFYALASMPDHVVKTFWRFKDSGASPSFKCFIALLTALVDAGKPEKVQDLMKQMDRFGFAHSVYTYNATVKAFCKMNDYESALKVLGTMRESGFEPTEVTYDTIMDSLNARLRRNEIAEDKVEELVKKLLESCTSESISYGIGIQKLCKKGTVMEAMAILQEAISKGVHLDFHTLNTLVISLCMNEKFKEAKDVLEMIRNPRLRCTQGCNMLARHFARAGDIEAAVKMCEDMLDNGRFLQNNTACIVLNSIGKSKEVQNDSTQKFIDRVRTRLPETFMDRFDSELSSLNSSSL
eukprot:TRINITY_DN3873_c0_g1_i1.p1 TRINITY_DN3873_c0_g1~~TRINITY_DN3873_c0_g1_i1.p1  ORF type:complete len:457 (-),score=30.59 TRINITY_DN3873_c0_g1_i1:295-1596(-)